MKEETMQLIEDIAGTNLLDQNLINSSTN